MSSLLSLLLLLLSATTCYCDGSDRKLHIVYMGANPAAGVTAITAAASHHTMLGKVLGSDSSSSESLVYSYSRSFNGFAARVTSEEAARLSEMAGVVSVLPNRILQLHTTRSWDFMGFTQVGVPRSPLEGDVIVGMLDTGLWPEAESFSDEGFGPPPAKWKGICHTSNNFTCNNKVIGARYYNSNDFQPGDIPSPRDSEGHGTHTSSTASGRIIPRASYHGLAEGAARGAVPSARLAVYKVCWAFGCSDADMLAAFDDAIADGVDIISISIGGGGGLDYFEDSIAIGSFHAMKAGILTSNSAGNSGPFPASLSNYAPWSLIVAASSIDRKIVSQVVLGNGKTYTGIAINSFRLNGTAFPLIYGGDAVNVSAGSSTELSALCVPGSLNSVKTRGKIVLCDDVSSDDLFADGLGAITNNPDFDDLDVAFNVPFPSTIITSSDAKDVLAYIRSTKNPIGTILASEGLKDILAPVVVSFSSRGPNIITPDILKPDLTGPGVDILAAWPPVNGEKRSGYAIISGTSMSCPHVAGAAAYVKSMHPTWSPAALKSALMTTAKVMDSRKNEDAEFSYGSGHINPSKAIDPGLVYDASEKDYIDFLCKQGYNASSLRLLTGDDSTCSGPLGTAWGLNYPSFALSVPDGEESVATFSRVVTNVGYPNSTYRAYITAPSSLKITVEPSVLSFTSMGEEKAFRVTVQTGVLFQQPIMSASLTWSDGYHKVRSPIAVYTVLPSLLGPKRVRTFRTSSMTLKNKLSMKY